MADVANRAVAFDKSILTACRLRVLSGLQLRELFSNPNAFFIVKLPLQNPGHFLSSSTFRKAASPTSDTSTHFGSGEAAAS